MKKTKEEQVWYCPLCTRNIFFFGRRKKGIGNHLLEDLGEAQEMQYSAEDFIEEVHKIARKRLENTRQPLFI